MNKLEKKHPLAIRWFHWINFPVLAVMVWSGLLIYWANDIYRIGFGSTTLIKFFPDGFYHPRALFDTNGTVLRPGLYTLDHRLATGMAWHFLFMWLFFVNGFLYVVYTAISGEWRYLLPNRHTLAEALQVVLHDLHIRKEPLPRRKFNGAQQIAYTSVILMGAGSLITGLAIYKPTQFAFIDALFGGYMNCRFIHFWLTIGYVLFFLVHITQVVRAGWNNFRAMVTGYELAPADPTEETAG
jgi:thiosulfate reductase cytochrome b subunit